MSTTNYINAVLSNGRPMTELEIYELEIKEFKTSKKRRKMLQGIAYSAGDHAILKKRRTAIGESGQVMEVNNLPNNKTVDNQFGKVLKQKLNYILGKPITVDSEDEKYKEKLSQFFSAGFHKTLKRICRDSYECGIGYMFLAKTEKGLDVKRLDPSGVVPLWKDAEHTELDVLIRIYKTIMYEGQRRREIEKVEVYKDNGITRYILKNGKLYEDIENPGGSYYTEMDEYGDSTSWSWPNIPVIPFKANDIEQPLISRVKCLQDAYNTIWSMYMDTTEEDSGNNVLIIENYDGEDLGKFRHNLATYRAIKVKTLDGIKGDVRTLKIEVNPENYKTLLALLKQAIIENAMGYDAKDDRLSGNPNQMNIQSMYSDIDLDANDIETEYQYSLEQLLIFLDFYYNELGEGDYTDTQADFIFSRSIMLNETERIQNIIASSAVLSTETILAKHPWITDVGQELDRVKNEAGEELFYAEPKKNEKGLEDE